MQKIPIVKSGLKGWALSLYGRLLTPVLLTVTHFSTAWAADKVEKVAVFPSTPYDGYLIYESLAVFWIFIIGLIVIIRMKLREIERIQELGVDEEDQDAPLLR